MSALSPSAYRLGYRGDIEGLRAIAILLVVAAHARVPGFAGGFVGVDVFFVLSGYLITGLLRQEIARRHEISLLTFYVRRLKRLLPGLLLMLAATALAARVLVPALEQPEQARSAASAALWISNFFFAFEHLDYFSPGSENNLVLHTWSLGVEEQFYLVWPLLLVLVTGAWTGARRPPALQRIAIAMPVVLAASLALCAWWSQNDAALAFYMMPARAWQFALGALVHAFFPGRSAAASPPARRIDALLGTLGLVAIVAPAMLLDPTRPYPWPWALIPSAGSAALLAAGARSPGAAASAVLSLRQLQAIGRVSYSWYLWHWPVLLLGATLLDTRSLVTRAALALLSLAIATAAYAFVEKPIRRAKVLVRYPRYAIAGALALVACAGLAGFRWHEDALVRMHRPETLRLVNLVYDAPVIYSMECDSWYSNAEVKPCSFGPAGAPHTAVIIGDSVGLQWFPAVAKIFVAPEWRLVALTKSACPMVDVPIYYERIHRIYTECAQWRPAALTAAAALKPDVIVIGSVYTYDITPEQWTAGTRAVLAPLSEAAGHVFVLRSTPRLPFDARRCLGQRAEMPKMLSRHDIACTATALIPQSDAVYRAITAAASAFPNVSVVDMTPWVCPGSRCDAERDGVIIYRDSEHLTTHFAESLADPLARALGRTLPGVTGAPAPASPTITAAVPESSP